MKQYRALLQRILDEGTQRGDRTGTGTLSIFGHQMVFDLQEGFPAVTSKRLYYGMVVDELLWFLSGSQNVNDLPERTQKIWRDFEKNDKGYLGPIYGKQWRSWHAGGGVFVDQIAAVIKSLRDDPNSRRHIVSAWNVGELPYMALPPCHLLFQFYVDGHKLDCQLYQRSADTFLGVPFNIASYATLTHMIAQQVGLVPGRFIHTIGDAHIYLNHVDQVELLLSREPRELPTLSLAPRHSIDAYIDDDLWLVNYNPHPAISAPLSV